MLLSSVLFIYAKSYCLTLKPSEHDVFILKSRETGCSKQVGILSCSGDNIIIFCILNSKTSWSQLLVYHSSLSQCLSCPHPHWTFWPRSPLLADIDQYIPQLEIQFSQDGMIIYLHAKYCFHVSSVTHRLRGDRFVVFNQKSCRRTLSDQIQGEV